MAVTIDDEVRLADGRRGLIIGIDGNRLRVLLFDVRPAEVVDAMRSDVIAASRRPSVLRARKP